jgi:DNA helicase II / ATP-dependent DNA helicase PcrA
VFKFTEEQSKVINTVKIHVEVLACPGSGKTTVLIARINNLIQTGVSAKRILVISFSNKAVENVKQKLMNEDVVVKTFHSYANFLIKANYKGLGYKNSPTLITEAQSLLRMGKAIAAKPNSFKFVAKHYATLDPNQLLELYRLYHYSQDELKNLIQTETDDVNEAVFRKLNNIFKLYSKQKLGDSKIEYSDMIPLAKKLTLRKKSAIGFEYLFVDEAQDMSTSQAGLLSVMASSIPNVMSFGDSNQAIYGFMGGKYVGLSSLMNRVHKLKLTHSHRLPQPVADLAFELLNNKNDVTPIKGYTSKIKPKLLPFPEGGGRDVYPNLMKYIFTKSESNTASIAVLARTKSQLREVDAALLNKGFHTNRAYFHHDISHVLKVIELMNVLDSNKLVKPKTNLEKIKLEKKIAKVLDFPFSKKARRSYSDCRKISLRIMDANHLESKYQLAAKIYLKLLRANQGMYKDARIELGRWEAIARKFSTTTAFVKRIKVTNAKQSITLSTIHGAKGGEWDYVIVAGIVEGCIPFYKSVTREMIEEERRLLYVASTRARKELFLVQEYYKTYNQKSSFLTKRVEKLVEQMNIE